MNDSEIIKALECCLVLHKCEECPCDFDTNGKVLCKDLGLKILDLINRQQAEIESLKNANGLFEYLNYAAHHYVINGKTWTQEFATIEAKNKAIQDKVVLLSDIQTAKSKGVREFAEKLKEKLKANFNYGDIYDVVAYDCIDKLTEEMGCNDG